VVSDPDPIRAALDRIDTISGYTCRARTFVLASSTARSYGVMVIGIDPDKEAKISSLKSLIREGRYLTPADTQSDITGVLVGQLLAKNLRVTIGDEITILGQARDGSIAATIFNVAGIYASGIDEFDRSAIHMPLKAFQAVFAMGNAVHEIVVIGKKLTQVASIQSRVQAALAPMNTPFPLKVLTWEELLPGLRQAIQMDMVSGAIFYFFLIIVVAFSILNTFLMAIFERTREFGVLMAIGTRPGRLTRLVLTESAAMSLIGVAIGIAAGCLITGYFQVHGISLGDSADLLRQYGISGRIYPKLSLLSASLGPAIVWIITLLSAVYPALKIRNLKPVEALVYH
jgi:ABC-type lipoprotein release transport system permease subunit